MKRKLCNMREIKTKRHYQKIIKKASKNLDRSSMASEEHMTFLEKELIHVNNMLIFESILEKQKKEDVDLLNTYCRSISSAFQYLTICYRKKSSLHKAYFTHVLSRFPELIQSEDDSISYAMMHFATDSSIYCRENAMLFFYRKTSEKLVVNSLKKMSKRELYYSPKLLADDLLKFAGEGKALCELLLKEFDNFNTSYQIGIINYLRFSKEDWNEVIYTKFQAKKYNKEVRLAIIRYFQTHKYEPFLEELLKIIEDKSRNQYEYRLVVAFALASYDNKRSRDALMECLCDMNYYVRKNAAISLSKMKLTEQDFKKLETIEDPYAQDMLQYIFKQSGVKKLVNTNGKDGKQNATITRAQ